MSAALVSCPACSKQISMAAASCIHCGHPMRSSGSVLRVGTWFMAMACLSILVMGLYRTNVINLESLQDWALPDLASFASAPVSSQAVPTVLDEQSTTQIMSAHSRADLTEIADDLSRRASPYWNEYYKVGRITFSPNEHQLTISYSVKAGMDENDIPVGVFAGSYCRDSAYQIFRDYRVKGHIVFKNEKGELLRHEIDPSTCS